MTMNVDAAVAALRAAFSLRQTQRIKHAVADLRQVAPEHPDVYLATAALLDAQGRQIEAVTARIIGYERSLGLTGDLTARKPLDNLLNEALAHPRGLDMLVPAAACSADAAVLATLAYLACNRGQFEQAELAMERLLSLHIPVKRDLSDVVALSRRMDSMLVCRLDGTVESCKLESDDRKIHYSTFTKALIGIAVRHSYLSVDFGRSLPEVLITNDYWSDAVAQGCVTYMQCLGQDACAEAFFDAAYPQLSQPASVDILNDALVSCFRRGSTDAFARLAIRLNSVTGSRLAGLTRLASYSGVESAKSPKWADLLSHFYVQASQRTEAAAQSATAAPLLDKPHIAPKTQPSEERIDVFLKCVRRPFDIKPFISFWLDCFSDPTRYRIRLLDDSDLQLKEQYPEYDVYDSNSLRNGPNSVVDFLREGRRPLNMLGWESVANLTPFVETESVWFWNIDADDMRPIIDDKITVDTVRERLRSVEVYAANTKLLAISYDLWASSHYLVNHGYHWTFGICLCRSEPPLLDAILSATSNVDIPEFSINVDHLLSRASEGYIGQGRFADLFASFVLDGVRIIQNDIAGETIYHSSTANTKSVSFRSDGRSMYKNRLHPKTLVV